MGYKRDVAKKNFLVLMMAKSDDLTNFNEAFLDMVRFIENEKLTDRFFRYLEKRNKL